MNEILPMVSGLIAGVMLGGLAPRLRLLFGAAAAVVLGTLATVISGEHLVSWGFLLVDIPLVGLFAVVGVLVSRAIRLRLPGLATRSE